MYLGCAKIKILCKNVAVKEERPMELAYGKKELEQIAKLYEVKGAYKLKKAELVEALLEAIPAKMPEILPMLDEADIVRFEALLDADKVVTSDLEVEPYYNLMEVELVQLLDDKGTRKLCVADLVKDAYVAIDKAPILDEVRANSMMRRHVISTLNLYGVVKLEWAAQLYNKYHEVSITAETLSKFAKKDMRLVCQCKVIDGYLVEETIYALDKTNFSDFVSATVDKEYYVPSKALLENMYEECYYEPTLQIERLKSYLRNNYVQDEEIIEDAVVAVTMIARVDCDRTGKSMELILEELDNIGIVFDSLADINEMIKHISAVVNTTRKWINKGFTPDELSPHKTDARTGQKINVIDIGRNAPCPCGSGKKYKKCCGNK